MHKKKRKVFLALISNKNLVSVYVYDRQGITLKIEVFGSSNFMGCVVTFAIWSFLMSFRESQGHSINITIFLIIKARECSSFILIISVS